MLPRRIRIHFLFPHNVPGPEVTSSGEDTRNKAEPANQNSRYPKAIHPTDNPE